MRIPPFKVLKKRLRRALARSLSPQEYIRELQVRHPPRYDPPNTLLRDVRKCLPPEVDAMFRHGILWAGEVGVMTPNAKILPIPPGEEYAIEFYSGIKSLVYTVARAIAAATNIYSPPPTPPIKAVLSIQQIAPMIGKVFLTYATSQELLVPRHSIHEEQKRNAHHLASRAEFFLLAHEIAHAWAAYESVASAEISLRGHERTKDEELACDCMAIQWLLEDALTRSDKAEPPPPVRMVYAGAEFALRILACLEHVGTPFEDTHPVAADRLEVLRYSAGELCSKLNVPFDQVRTIAVTHDEFLEAIERTVRGVDPTPTQDRGRVRSKLFVVLEECAKGMVDEEFALAEMNFFLKYSSPEIMAAAARDARDQLDKTQPATAQLLGRLMARLPAPVPALFSS